MIRVAIADDHQIFRRGLKEMLSEQGDLAMAGEAASPADLMDLLSKSPFDVLILDLSMPGTSGLDTLTNVRSRYPKIAVIILSMYPAEQYAVRALKAGAAGYLTKESAGEQLVEGIRRVCTGQLFVTQQVGELLAREVLQPQSSSRHAALSEQEHRVFLHLANGVALKDVAEKLEVSVKTVSTYRARILEKMAFTSNADLIKYAIDHQLR